MKIAEKVDAGEKEYSMEAIIEEMELNSWNSCNVVPAVP